MRVRVLGSAAGGGFPQWNCNCRNCRALRQGTLRAQARTQSSIAVSGADERSWVLINASPDILQQLQANPVLQPGRAARDTALRAIVLTDGQIDHTTGLLMLREATQPWPLWCTDSVYADLVHGHPVLRLLEHYCGVDRRRIDLAGEWFELDAADEVQWRATHLQSKPAPYSPHRDAPVSGDNIGLSLRDLRTRRTLFYAPGVGAVDETTWEAMRAANLVLVDGSFWSDEEMLRAGLSSKRARDMGHLPQSGRGGMIEWLDRLPAATRKVLIHINNTNPILDEDSPERAELTAHGIEVAYDGMEWAL